MGGRTLAVLALLVFNLVTENPHGRFL